MAGEERSEIFAATCGMPGLQLAMPTLPHYIKHVDTWVRPGCTKRANDLMYSSEGCCMRFAVWWQSSENSAVTSRKNGGFAAGTYLPSLTSRLKEGGHVLAANPVDIEAAIFEQEKEISLLGHAPKLALPFVWSAQGPGVLHIKKYLECPAAAPEIQVHGST